MQLVRLVSSVIIPILGWDFAVVEIKTQIEVENQSFVVCLLAFGGH